ncbi:MAG: prepilin-type N-terminal cleavage/methylation domain-containing protein [Verrucomicrobiae bacterium]|nr:prepilin-type N-terminal cleavage/methylation domain-containing protein [Verrucomicrobiae bacterium]
MSKKEWNVGRLMNRPEQNLRLFSAFTMTELVVSVAIIALLATVAYPSLKGFKKRAEKAKCIANMKVIHTGMDGYLLDRNVWPQMPGEAFEWDEEEYYGWWIRTIEPYGVGQDSWICPSDRILNEMDQIPKYAASYAPALFNSHQFTPYRWKQPWLVERGDYHGKGAHIMMPDGSIVSSQSPWSER